MTQYLLRKQEEEMYREKVQKERDEFYLEQNTLYLAQKKKQLEQEKERKNEIDRERFKHRYCKEDIQNGHRLRCCSICRNRDRPLSIQEMRKIIKRNSKNWETFENSRITLRDQKGEIIPNMNNVNILEALGNCSENGLERLDIAVNECYARQQITSDQHSAFQNLIERFRHQERFSNFQYSE